MPPWPAYEWDWQPGGPWGEDAEETAAAGGSWSPPYAPATAASVEAPPVAAAAATAAGPPLPVGDWGVVLPVVLQESPAVAGMWCVLLHSHYQAALSVESLLEYRDAHPAVPWRDHNVALKCLRDWQEAEHPEGGHVENLSEVPVLQIKKINHPKGMDYEWDHDAPTTPWDWRGFLAHLREETLREVAGSGLRAFALASTPDSYDSKRSHAARLAHRPQRRKLTVWDFFAVQTDGTVVAFHPDYKKSTMGVRAYPAEPTHDVPRSGKGGSEGPGTYRRYLRLNYPEVRKNQGQPAPEAAPATAPAVAGPAAPPSASAPASSSRPPPPPPG